MSLTKKAIGAALSLVGAGALAAFGVVPAFAADPAPTSSPSSSSITIEESLPAMSCVAGVPQLSINVYLYGPGTITVSATNNGTSLGSKTVTETGGTNVVTFTGEFLPGVSNTLAVTGSDGSSSSGQYTGIACSSTSGNGNGNGNQGGSGNGGNQGGNGSGHNGGQGHNGSGNGNQGGNGHNGSGNGNQGGSGSGNSSGHNGNGNQGNQGGNGNGSGHGNQGGQGSNGGHNGQGGSGHNGSGNGGHGSSCTTPKAVGAISNTSTSVTYQVNLSGPACSSMSFTGETYNLPASYSGSGQFDSTATPQSVIPSTVKQLTIPKGQSSVSVTVDLPSALKCGANWYQADVHTGASQPTVGPAGTAGLLQNGGKIFKINVTSGSVCQTSPSVTYVPVPPAPQVCGPTWKLPAAPAGMKYSVEGGDLYVSITTPGTEFAGGSTKADLGEVGLLAKGCPTTPTTPPTTSHGTTPPTSGHTTTAPKQVTPSKASTTKSVVATSTRTAEAPETGGVGFTTTDGIVGGGVGAGLVLAGIVLFGTTRRRRDAA